jgi:hypothetical protein
MNISIIKELTGVLIKNIDESNIKEKEIDLIISGGAFNVSYLAGCLYFICEMREKGLIRINKISTCSASSIMGLLFLIDKVDIFVEKLYELLIGSFKRNRNVIFDEESLSSIIKIIEGELPEDVLDKINNRLYITYYDVIDCKHVIKSTFEDVNDIIKTIRRSCFIPYITKRDKIVMHRILGGIIDIHNFFFKCKETSMCCYVEDWGIIRMIEFKMLEFRLYMICVFIYILVMVNDNIINKHYKDNKVIKFICNMLRENLSKIVEKYCV